MIQSNIDTTISDNSGYNQSLWMEVPLPSYDEAMKTLAERHIFEFEKEAKIRVTACCMTLAITSFAATLAGVGLWADYGNPNKSEYNNSAILAGKILFGTGFGCCIITSSLSIYNCYKLKVYRSSPGLVQM